MIVTSKNDVKNHLSARGRSASGQFLSPGQPQATVFSAAELVEIKEDPTGFVEDFLGEHSPHGASIVPDLARNPLE
jgi:hypothetical protein